MDGSFSDQPVRCECRASLRTKGKRDNRPNNLFDGHLHFPSRSHGSEPRQTSRDLALLSSRKPVETVHISSFLDPCQSGSGCGSTETSAATPSPTLLQIRIPARPRCFGPRGEERQPLRDPP